MANTNTNLDEVLTETLTALTEASGILTGGPKAGRRRAPGGLGPGIERWLCDPPTLLLFRTSQCATLASEQVIRRGFGAWLFQRYLLVEAPWLFVAALLASIGLEAELVAIHWERIEPEEKNSHLDEARRE